MLSEGGDNVLEIEWLGDEIIGTCGEAGPQQILIRHAGDHDDWNAAIRGILPDQLAEFDTVHFGHVDIKEDAVKGLRCGTQFHESIKRVMRDLGYVATLRIEEYLQDVASIRIVVDDEHPEAPIVVTTLRRVLEVRQP